MGPIRTVTQSVTSSWRVGDARIYGIIIMHMEQSIASTKIASP
jgi:hypothetical protein